MKVINSYSDDIGYICFELESGEVKKFPAYWAFSMWSGADSHEELQSYLKQVEPQKIYCKDCGKEFNLRFPPQNKEYKCGICQAQDEMDADIFRILESAKGNY